MGRRHRIAVPVALAVAAVAVALVWLSRPSTLAVALTPDDPEVVALGGLVYAEHCAACHGADLEGQPNWRQRNPDGRLPAPPHDETGHTWHHPDIQLFRLTKFGPSDLAGGAYESDMPAYAAILADDEIVAVLSYIKSTWPAEIQNRHDQINARLQP